MSNRTPMRVPIAREGWPYLAAGLAISGVTALASRRLAVLPLLATGLIGGFFRDPERPQPESAEHLYAPADGHILAIDQIDEPLFIGGPACRIATFLSLFDVHINRSPADGVVRFRAYQPGRFHAAWGAAAERENERHMLGIATPHGPVLVVQISGAVARRIVCSPAEGQALDRGERIGLIKFGSRTDLIVPLGMAEPLVRLRQPVRGGVTPLARLR